MIYNDFQFIDQIASLEIDNNFADCTTKNSIFRYIKRINYNKKDVATKGIQNYYLIYDYDKSKS